MATFSDELASLIGCLPLSAKIGLTVVGTLLAWGIVTLSFIRFLIDPKTWFRPSAYGLLGVGLFLSTALIWW